MRGQGKRVFKVLSSHSTLKSEPKGAHTANSTHTYYVITGTYIVSAGTKHRSLSLSPLHVSKPTRFQSTVCTAGAPRGGHDVPVRPTLRHTLLRTARGTLRSTYHRGVKSNQNLHYFSNAFDIGFPPQTIHGPKTLRKLRTRANNSTRRMG